MEVAAEMVVLLGDDGREIGTAPRDRVHTTNTPLHRAFSCHVFSTDGRLLVTRRALHKRTWPGVWTNSFCGHPMPEEADLEAITRRGRYELGLELHDIKELIPQFRYRATDPSGIVENEVCPVYSAKSMDDPAPNRDEVVEWHWVMPHQVSAAAQATPFAFSPWFVDQLAYESSHAR